MRVENPAAYEEWQRIQTKKVAAADAGAPDQERRAELERFDAGVSERELDEVRSEAVEARSLDLQTNEGLSRLKANIRAAREAQARTGWQTPSAVPGVLEATARAAAIRRVPGDDPRDALSTLTRDYVANRMTPAAERAYRLLLPEGAENRLLGTPEEQEAARKELRESYGSAVVDALRFVEATDYQPGNVAGLAAGAAAGAIERRLPKQTEDSAGTALEVPETAALRFFGDYLPSVISEAGYSLPVVAAKQDGRVARPGDLAGRVAAETAAGKPLLEAMRDGLSDLDVGTARLEEVFLGTTPEERGLLPDAVMSDRWWLTRSYIRAMQKLENNRTLGDDLEVAAQDAGPEGSTQQWAAKKAAYMGGLAAQTFLPWELALAPVTKGVKAARATAALPEGIDRVRAFSSFLTNRQMDLAHDMRKVAEDAIRSGIDAKDWLADLRMVEPRFVDTIEAMLAEQGAALPVWERMRPKAPDLPPSPGPLREPPPAPARVDLHQTAGADPPKVRDTLVRATQQAADEAAAAAVENDDLIARIRAQAAENVKAAGLDRPLRTMGEYYDWVTARTRALKGNDRAVVTATKLQPPPGGGYQALQHLDPPGASPASPGYRLLDRGNVVVSGTLDDVLQAMKVRRHFADRIDFEGRRSVASWRNMADSEEAVAASLRRRRAPEKLVVDAAVDRDFASPAERAMVQAKMKGEALTIADVIQQIEAKVNLTGLPVDTFQRVLAAVLGGSKAKVGRPVRALTPEDIDVLDAVEDAMRARLRATYGDDALVQPRVGMVMTKPEWTATQRRMQTAAEEVGFDLSRVSLGDRLREGRALDFGDDANRRAAEAWAARSGVAVPAGQLTDDDWLDVFERVLKVEAGRSADARWAVQGSGDTSRKILDAVASVTSRDPTWATNVLVGQRYESRFKLSRNMQAILDRVERDLRNVPARLLADLQEAQRQGAAPHDALHRVLETYRPVSQAELDLVDAVRQTENGSPAAWRDLARRIAAETREPHRWPGLVDGGPKATAEAVAAWAQDRSAHVDRLARQLIRAAIADHPRYKDLSATLAASPVLHPDQSAGAWRAFAANGDLHAAVAPVIGQLFGPAVAEQVAKLDPKRALTNFALVLKSDEVAAAGSKRLLEAEFGTATPEGLEALEHVLKGGPRPASVLDSDLYRARALVNRLGLDHGNGPVAMGKWGGVHMPAGWAEELARAQAAGVRLNDESWPVVSWLYGAYKSALTSYNPAFHVTTAMGIPYMLLQQRGAEAAGAVTALGKRPAIALTLGLRLSGVRAYQPKWLNRVENTVRAGGRIYSIEAIERALLRNGVGQGTAAALNGRKIMDSLERNSGVMSRLRSVPGDIHDAVTGISGVLEGAVKAGVALDALEKGASLDAAAMAAKSALYDYDDLTEADKAIAAGGLVFWKFHRKNLDSFWKQVADNPQRVGTMLRYAQHQRTMLMSEQEKALTSDRDVGRQVLAVTDTPIGKLVLSTGSVMTAPEALMLTQDLLRATFGTVVDPVNASGAQQQLLGQAHPLIQLGVQSATNVDPGTGFRIDPAMSNVVPEWLVESPLTSALMDAWLDVERKPLPPGADPSRGAGYGVHGPYVYVPGDGTGKDQPGDPTANNVRDWRLFQATGLGRLVGSTAQDVWAAATDEERRAPALFRLFGGNIREIPLGGEEEGVMRDLRKPAESELQRMKARGEAATR